MVSDCHKDSNFSYKPNNVSWSTISMMIWSSWLNNMVECAFSSIVSNCTLVKFNLHFPSSLVPFFHARLFNIQINGFQRNYFIIISRKLFLPLNFIDSTIIISSEKIIKKNAQKNLKLLMLIVMQIAEAWLGSKIKR